MKEHGVEDRLIIDKCISCWRFHSTLKVVLCAFEKTNTVYICPCVDCIIKVCCSIMCHDRIQKLDLILGKKRK